jgi:hypothetical protein
MQPERRLKAANSRRAGRFPRKLPGLVFEPLLLAQQESEKSQGVWGTASSRFVKLGAMKKYNWHIAVPHR